MVAGWVFTHYIKQGNIGHRYHEKQNTYYGSLKGAIEKLFNQIQSYGGVDAELIPEFNQMIDRNSFDFVYPDADDDPSWSIEPIMFVDR